MDGLFVDFCYANATLREGGILTIDDSHLHSIKELGRMLMLQPEFKLVAHHQKTALFRKITNVRSLPEWVGQPYIVQRSSEYERAENQFSIQH